MKSRMLKIDTEMLQERIALEGHTNASLSRLMGFGDNYLTNCIRRGNITPSGLQLLEACGVKTEGLVIKETPAKEVKPEATTPAAGQTVVVTLSDEDWVKLYKTIVKAVKNGIKFGFEEADK